MDIIFYIAAVVAIFATLRVITGKNAVHSLLYMIVSLLAVSVLFFTLGAPFLAALEVIIYAGAIMVLMIFVIMMLNMGEAAVKQEKSWFTPTMWIGPSILVIVLLAEVILIIYSGQSLDNPLKVIGPEEVGKSLFGPYILGVEMVAMLLMAGIVGAYHIGKKKQKEYHRYLQEEAEEA